MFISSKTLKQSVKYATYYLPRANITIVGGRGLELDSSLLSSGELGMMAASGAAGPGFKSRRPHQTILQHLMSINVLMPF